ncbi:SAM-dependent chlorinase/fluorinase, partial [Desulfobacterales bacterium HSG17]|nr:SAM-dependent chlorinase/fluorinase [Desulfobacterales bacterium HSG17]
NVHEASFKLEAAVSYLPPGTIHVSVVDPGVGTNRSILAAGIGNSFYLAPDNGMLGSVLNRDSCAKIYKVQNSAYMLENVSQTFHGRDIFAPVAAHLSFGVPISEMGPEIFSKDIVDLAVEEAFLTAQGEIHGQFLYADRFGNLITNIHFALLEKIQKKYGETLEIQAGKYHINQFGKTYAEGTLRKPVALIGSSGYLEIAVNMGSAARMLSDVREHAVKVRLRKN